MSLVIVNIPPILTNPKPTESEVEILLQAVENTIDLDTDEDNVRMREQCIIKVAEFYRDRKNARDLGNLIQRSRFFLSQISKAKAAKLVRSLVDMFLDLEAGTGTEVKLCQECIDWAVQEKRTFLRQSLESRLIALYYDTGKYQDALQLGSRLLKELKKLDDKNLLVEVQLIESKTYHALSNLPKARAALTSARTTANSIYTPPKMQAALDLQSGILHAADEKDFKTAFSYFYEAFEGYNSVDHPKAIVALKYMLLSKIVLKVPEDVASLLSGKLALRYSGREVDALRAIAQASIKRSLADFQQALVDFKPELEDDPIIKCHMESLYDTMLEQNLERIIEPYVKVQIDHVAMCIGLPREKVELKLSQMILDKKLSGILDQGAGVLIIFDESKEDKTYAAAIDTIASLSKVVDTLYQKAKKLT